MLLFDFTTHCLLRLSDVGLDGGDDEQTGNEQELCVCVCVFLKVSNQKEGGEQNKQ